MTKVFVKVTMLFLLCVFNAVSGYVRRTRPARMLEHCPLRCEVLSLWIFQCKTVVDSIATCLDLNLAGKSPLCSVCGSLHLTLQTEIEHSDMYVMYFFPLPFLRAL